MRWLRARKLDLDAAEEMLRASLKWRDSYHPDELVKTYETPELFDKYWPGGIHGESKDGHLVLVNRFAGA